MQTLKQVSGGIFQGLHLRLTSSSCSTNVLAFRQGPGTCLPFRLPSFPHSDPLHEKFFFFFLNQDLVFWLVLTNKRLSCVSISKTDYSLMHIPFESNAKLHSLEKFPVNSYPHSFVYILLSLLN